MSSSDNSELCRALIQRLSELEADRARVLRHLSHELKTPLAALREGVALLQEGVLGSLTAEQREVTAILDSNTRALQRQIEELLSYHVTVFDVVRLQRRRVVLRELLDAVVDAQRLQLQGRALDVLVDCRVEQAWLDPDKLRVALGNLLSNAIAFSPEGGEIRLCAGCEGDRLWIDCLDQGPGVAAKDAALIFEPFSQGSRQPASGRQGSGVGLSIVREAVVAQGGRVSLMPAASGAHFRVELPYEA
jgi:two-component system sensor histidine kinase GlrK